MCRILTDNQSSFSLSASNSASIRSIGCTPSLVASRLETPLHPPRKQDGAATLEPVTCKAAGCDQQTFVSPSGHRSSKFPDGSRTYAILPTLALKYYWEADQPRDPDNSIPVDSAVAGTPGNLNFDEPRFSEKPLTKPLEAGWIHLLKDIQQGLTPVKFIFRVHTYGSVWTRCCWIGWLWTRTFCR